MTPIRIVLIDNSEVFRSTLAKTIEAKGFLILSAITHAQTKTELGETLPDIIVMSYKTRSPETLETARYINTNFPLVKLIVYTLFDHTIPKDAFKDIRIDRLLIQSIDDLENIDKVILEVFQSDKN